MPLLHSAPNMHYLFDHLRQGYHQGCYFRDYIMQIQYAARSYGRRPDAQDQHHVENKENPAETHMRQHSWQHRPRQQIHAYVGIDQTIEDQYMLTYGQDYASAM